MSLVLNQDYVAVSDLGHNACSHKLAMDLAGWIAGLQPRLAAPLGQPPGHPSVQSGIAGGLANL
jgi:hypothetical protein